MVQDIFFPKDDDYVPAATISVSSDTSEPPLARLARVSTTVMTPPSPAVQLTLLELCNLLEERRSAQDAEIVRVEGYRENVSGIVHRFLVLELALSGLAGGQVYLRLDRRANRTAPQLMLALGKVTAYDTVSCGWFLCCIPG